MIGRTAELAVVEAFLDAVPSGAAGLSIVGEAGIGKTTLWEAVTQRAADRGWRVLRARPAESEKQFSFSGLTDLCEPLDAEVRALPPPQRRALEVAVLSRDDDGEPPDQRTVAAAVLGVLRQAAVAGPLLVAIDDVQWLDDPSAAALRFAMRRLGSAPAGVSISLRSEEGLTDPIGIGTTLPAAATRVLCVGPLSLAALHELVRQRLGLHLAHHAAARLHETVGGNPFYAIELARSIGATRLAPGEPWPIPPDLRTLLRDRLARLPAAEREALLVVGACAQPSPDLVESVLGPPGRAALRELAEAQLIVTEGSRLRASHPLLASVCYSEASAEVRHRVHRSLARSIDEPEERARHLALGSSGSDREVAAALQAASESAAARGAPSTAAELCEQALALTPVEDRPARVRRLVSAAEFHFRANDPVRARALLEEATEALPPGPPRAAVLRLLGDVLTVAHDHDAAVRAFEQGLQEAGDDREVARTLRLNLGYTYVQQADIARARHHIERLLEEASELDDVQLSMALSGKATVDLFAGKGLQDEDVERVLSLDDLDAPRPVHLKGSWTIAVLLTLVGRLSEALPIFQRLWDRSVELGHEESLAQVVAWVVWIECQRGDILAAERHAATIMENAELGGGAILLGIALVARCFVQAYSGDVAGIRRDAPQAASLLNQTHQPVVATFAISMLGFVEQSLGDAAAAHRILGPLRQFIPPVGTGEPGSFIFVADEIEALVGTGQMDDASSLLEWFEERGRTLNRPAVMASAARCGALLAAARGELGEATRLIDTAVGFYDNLCRPVDHGRSLLVKGQLHRRMKEKRAAKEALEHALTIFESVHSLRWADRARADLTRLGLRPPAPTDLTATEARVAELAALGLTNREVAERVFITAKSVEGVLARVYRKLGIRSRAELGAAMARSRDGG